MNINKIKQFYNVEDLSQLTKSDWDSLIKEFTLDKKFIEEYSDKLNWYKLN